MKVLFSDEVSEDSRRVSKRGAEITYIKLLKPNCSVFC